MAICDRVCLFLLLRLAAHDNLLSLCAGQPDGPVSPGDDDEPRGSNTSTTLVVVTCVALVVIVSLLVAVIMNSRKRTVRGKSWFPDGFFGSKRPRLDGKESSLSTPTSSHSDNNSQSGSEESDASPPPAGACALQEVPSATDAWRESEVGAAATRRPRPKVRRRLYIKHNLLFLYDYIYEY